MIEEIITNRDDKDPRSEHYFLAGSSETSEDLFKAVFTFTAIVWKLKGGPAAVHKYVLYPRRFGDKKLLIINAISS